MQSDDDRAAAVGGSAGGRHYHADGESHVYREVKGVKRDGYWPRRRWRKTPAPAITNGSD